MGPKVYLVLVYVFVTEIKEWVAPEACLKSSDKLVVSGCRNNAKGEAQKIYLDTGTGPTQQINQCRCQIVITRAPTIIRIDPDERIKETTHTLKIAGVVINSTVTNGSVTIMKTTDIWITTDGVGGFCVELAADENIIVTCFPQSSQQTNTTSSATSVPDLTGTSTGQSRTVARSTASLNNSTSDAKLDIIGPLAGGASGFAVLTLVVILVVVYSKKKKSYNKEEKKDKCIKLRSPEDEAQDDYTTENPMYEKADNLDGKLQDCKDSIAVLSRKHAISQMNDSNVTEHNDDTDGEYNYVTDIEQISSSTKKTEQADLPEYSSVHKLQDQAYDQGKHNLRDLPKHSTQNRNPTKENEYQTTRMGGKQENQDSPIYSTVRKGNTNSESDVYDRTDDHKLETGGDAYHRLGAYSGKDETYNSLKKSVQTSNDADGHYGVSG